MKEQKNERFIYTLDLFEGDETVIYGDEILESNMNPVVEINGVSLDYANTNFFKAYEDYMKLVEYVRDCDFTWRTELIRETINVTEQEWTLLAEKERLEYEDYGKFKTQKSSFAVCWDEDFEHDDNYISEVLRLRTEYFNMRVVCEKAGINYTTFRGFKYNGKGFSNEKALMLLKTMYELGNESWNDELESRYRKQEENAKY